MSEPRRDAAGCILNPAVAIEEPTAAELEAEGDTHSDPAAARAELEQQGAAAQAKLQKAQEAAAYYERAKTEGFSWAGLGGAAAAGAAACSWCGPYGPIIGAAAGAIIYGLGLGEQETQGPPLAPYPDPTNPRLLWHHEARRAGFVNLKPLQLECVINADVLRSNARAIKNYLQAYFPTGLAGARAVAPYASAMVFRATGMVRTQHPVYKRGCQPVMSGAGRERDMVGCIGDWASPADCRLNIYRPSDQAAWSGIVEQWLDAAGLADDLRPDYDMLYVAEVETPAGEFMLPNGPLAGIWPHAGYPSETLTKMLAVGRPDPEIPPPIALPIYPLVLWVWHPARCAPAAGCNSPPPENPELRNTALLALEVPVGRPYKRIDLDAGDGASLLRSRDASGWGWIVGPLAAGVLGVAVKKLGG